MSQHPQDTSLTYREMRAAIRRELALAPEGDLSTLDQQRVDRVLTEALRDYIGSKYNWHWLTQTTAIVTASGTDAYPLPFFYAGIEQIAYGPANDSPCLGIRVVTPEHMDQLRSGTPSVTGDPAYATTIPGEQSGEWKIQLWPTPGSVRTLTLRFRATLRRPGPDDHSFFAGPAYDSLVLTACRYAARMDRRIDPQGADQRYAEALGDAIRIDKLAEPRLMGTLGINGAVEPARQINRPLYWNDELIV